jgi:hypothetical protein
VVAQTFLYGNASQQFATKQWNWPALQVSALLVSAGYVPRINSDVHVSDIPSAAILARSNAQSTYMGSMASVNGVCSGILPVFDGFLNVTPVAAIVLYVDTGVDSTSQLIYYSNAGAGFPFTGQGFNYAVVNDQAYGGWFQV